MSEKSGYQTPGGWMMYLSGLVGMVGALHQENTTRMVFFGVLFLGGVLNPIYWMLRSLLERGR